MNIQMRERKKGEEEGEGEMVMTWRGRDEETAREQLTVM